MSSDCWRSNSSISSGQHWQTVSPPSTGNTAFVRLTGENVPTLRVERGLRPGNINIRHSGDSRDCTGMFICLSDGVIGG